MLPVSAWPPGPPGASLSPFGKPRAVNVGPCGYVLPKGAWIVSTTSNQVVMFQPRLDPWTGVSRTPGTGFLPGQIPPRRSPCAPTPVAPTARNAAGAARRPIPEIRQPANPGPWAPPLSPPPFHPGPQPKQFMKYNDYVEAWRAWQRCIGRTDPPIRPLPGRRPPNWFGWRSVCAPFVTLVNFWSGGTVLADGQNVVIQGGGCATITQAFSV